MCSSTLFSDHLIMFEKKKKNERKKKIKKLGEKKSLVCFYLIFSKMIAWSKDKVDEHEAGLKSLELNILFVR